MISQGNKRYTHRKAELKDLKKIIELYLEDDLGQNREILEENIDPGYLKAFEKINQDPNQYLMVVETESEGGAEIIATCQLTLMPTLVLQGSMRMNIEGVRVSEKYRGQKIGEWMMQAACEYGQSHGAVIAQLTTNKKRIRAKSFYERLGFEASHKGMKLKLD